MEKDAYVLTPREDDEESGENADFYTIESSPGKGSKGFKDTTAMFGNMEVDKNIGKIQILVNYHFLFLFWKFGRTGMMIFIEKENSSWVRKEGKGRERE